MSFKISDVFTNDVQ